MISEEGESPGYSWSVDRWMLPNYCLNVGFRRGACHPAAPEWVKLCLRRRCFGGWTQVEAVRTPGSRCWLGPHCLSRPPTLHPAGPVSWSSRWAALVCKVCNPSHQAWAENTELLSKLTFNLKKSHCLLVRHVHLMKMKMTVQTSCTFPAFQMALVVRNPPAMQETKEM